MEVTPSPPSGKEKIKLITACSYLYGWNVCEFYYSVVCVFLIEHNKILR